MSPVAHSCERAQVSEFAALFSPRSMPAQGDQIATSLRRLGNVGEPRLGVLVKLGRRRTAGRQVDEARGNRGGERNAGMLAARPIARNARNDSGAVVSGFDETLDQLGSRDVGIE